MNLSCLFGHNYSEIMYTYVVVKDDNRNCYQIRRFNSIPKICTCCNKVPLERTSYEYSGSISEVLGMIKRGYMSFKINNTYIPKELGEIT